MSQAEFNLRCDLHAHTPESYERYLQNQSRERADVNPFVTFNENFDDSSSIDSEDLFSSL